MEKTQGKICNTGKTQGKHREFYLGSNVATLYKWTFVNGHYNAGPTAVFEVFFQWPET